MKQESGALETGIRCTCRDSGVAMAFALVHWKVEDRFSIISASWVVEPSAIPPNSELPVEGKAYWRKKTAVYDVTIVTTSGISEYYSLHSSRYTILLRF